MILFLSWRVSFNFSRWKMTGSLWRWWWTACSCGFSLSLSLVISLRLLILFNFPRCTLFSNVHKYYCFWTNPKSLLFSSWHRRNNPASANLVRRPARDRRAPLGDRGRHLHKATRLQRASRALWHRLNNNNNNNNNRRTTPTPDYDTLTIYTKPQDFNGPPGLYDIV